MGSLMSGWNSRLQDPKKVKFMRNKSLTRGEIDAYWKSKKKTEEDHFKSISPSASMPTTPSSTSSARDNDDELVHHERETRKVVYFRRSTSMPMERTSSSELHVSAVDRFTAQDRDLEPLIVKKTSCWWTSSNWAFLNEPPVLTSEATEKPSYKLVHTH